MQKPPRTYKERLWVNEDPSRVPERVTRGKRRVHYRQLARDTNEFETLIPALPILTPVVDSAAAAAGHPQESLFSPLHTPTNFTTPAPARRRETDSIVNNQQVQPFHHHEQQQEQRQNSGCDDRNFSRPAGSNQANRSTFSAPKQAQIPATPASSGQTRIVPLSTSRAPTRVADRFIRHHLGLTPSFGTRYAHNKTKPSTTPVTKQGQAIPHRKARSPKQELEDWFSRPSSPARSSRSFTISGRAPRAESPRWRSAVTPSAISPLTTPRAIARAVISEAGATPVARPPLIVSPVRARSSKAVSPPDSPSASFRSSTTTPTPVRRRRPLGPPLKPSRTRSPSQVSVVPTHSPSVSPSWSLSDTSLAQSASSVTIATMPGSRAHLGVPLSSSRRYEHDRERERAEYDDVLGRIRNARTQILESNVMSAVALGGVAPRSGVGSPALGRGEVSYLDRMPSMKYRANTS